MPIKTFGTPAKASNNGGNRTGVLTKPAATKAQGGKPGVLNKPASRCASCGR